MFCLSDRSGFRTGVNLRSSSSRPKAFYRSNCLREPNPICPGRTFPVLFAGQHSVAFLQFAVLFVHCGFDLPISVGAVAMSLSTIIVAANAQLLRRLKLAARSSLVGLGHSLTKESTRRFLRFSIPNFLRTLETWNFAVRSHMFSWCAISLFVRCLKSSWST